MRVTHHVSHRVAVGGRRIQLDKCNVAALLQRRAGRVVAAARAGVGDDAACAWRGRTAAVWGAVQLAVGSAPTPSACTRAAALMLPSQACRGMQGLRPDASTEATETSGMHQPPGPPTYVCQQGLHHIRPAVAVRADAGGRVPTRAPLDVARHPLALRPGGEGGGAIERGERVLRPGATLEEGLVPAGLTTCYTPSSPHTGCGGALRLRDHAGPRARAPSAGFPAPRTAAARAACRAGGGT